MPPVLTKRVLGLPAWAWFAIIAGGVTIGLVLRNRQEAGDEEAEEMIEDIPDESAGLVDDVYYDAAASPAVYEGTYPDYVLTPPGGGANGGYLPNAQTPNIEVNIGGNVGNQGKECKRGSKPNRRPPRGYHWCCRNGKWVACPDSRQGGRQNGRRAKGRSVTGGGAPVRPNAHLAPV